MNADMWIIAADQNGERRVESFERLTLNDRRPRLRASTQSLTPSTLDEDIPKEH
jgi:hypothetical protein